MQLLAALHWLELIALCSRGASTQRFLRPCFHRVASEENDLEYLHRRGLNAVQSSASCYHVHLKQLHALLLPFVCNCLQGIAHVSASAIEDAQLTVHRLLPGCESIDLPELLARVQRATN